MAKVQSDRAKRIRAAKVARVERKCTTHDTKVSKSAMFYRCGCAT